MSLKLTVLDPEGRIWTIVAGGGASVVYADAIAVHGFAHELANYGGYSGAPTKSQTYEYAKTISGFFNLLDYPLFFLIVCSRLDHAGDSTTGWQDPYHWRGTPNFTNVVSTFKGIIRALKEMKAPLITHKVRIFVRRSGPNYREGLKAMRLLGESLSVSIAVLNLPRAEYWSTPTVTTATRTIRPMALRAGETPCLGGAADPVATGPFPSGVEGVPADSAAGFC